MAKKLFDNIRKCYNFDKHIIFGVLILRLNGKIFHLVFVGEFIEEILNTISFFRLNKIMNYQDLQVINYRNFYPKKV